ncbi:MAG: hypothetical protein M3Y87_13725 [Myxococcota bacterium]|nr:hypothetical protein [Myxococcota bacterium]
MIALLLPPGLARADSDAGACNTSRAYPASGAIPQNLPGFLVTGSGNDLTELALWRIDSDGGETPVAATTTDEPLLGDAVRLVPDAPLELGARYLLRLGPCIHNRTRTNEPFEYLVEAPRPLPTTLGTLQVSRLQRVSNHYSVELTVVPSAEMEPWLALHRIELWAETPIGPLQSRNARPGSDDLGLSARIEVDCPGSTGSPFPYSLDPGDFTAHASATPYFGGSVLDLQVTSSVACADAVDMTPRETPPAAGCAVHGRGASAWLPVLAVIGLGLMRRRRR